MKIRPFALERYFAKNEFRVEHLLCCSDCESMSVGDLLALEPGAAGQFQALRLGYTESRGGPALRRRIAGLYPSLGAEHVLVHGGAQEAIFLFMHAALQRGDHVVVHRPCYQSLFEVASSIGCRVASWLARESGGWRLDPDELPRLINRRTRAIVLNTPHNPTGYLMERDVFERTVKIADKNGIVLFSDEVYRGLEHERADRLPAAAESSPLAVSLGVMSKTYGLAGLRIGWIATRNAGLFSRMEGLKDYTTICASGPGEFLAETALRHAERIEARNLAIIKDNLALLDAFFGRHADRFLWRRPKAGPIAFPRLLGSDDVGAFCDALAREAGVLLLPGNVYEDRGNHFRIGFGRAGLPAAVERLEQFL